jgi:DNA-binding NtrC family response regulator
VAGVSRAARRGTLFISIGQGGTSWSRVRRLRQTASTSGSDSGIVVGVVGRSTEWEDQRRDEVRESLGPSLEVILIPPLRDRAGDFILLGRHFLEQAVSGYPSLSGQIRSLSTEAWRYLSTFTWPGNVKQLRAVMQSLALYLSNSDLSEAVTTSGDVQVEFVARCTGYLWAEPSRCERLRFHSVRDLSRHLAETFQYEGHVESLARTLYRRKPFRLVLREFFR